MSSADAVDMEQQAENDNEQQHSGKHGNGNGSSANRHSHPSATVDDNEPSKRQKTDGHSIASQQPNQPNKPQPSDPSTSTTFSSSTSIATSAATSSSVFAPQLPAPLYLVNSPARGRCVFSSMTLPAQAVLFRDAPLALIQFQKNKRRVLACSNCGAFIGSLAQQLNTLATTEGDTHTETAATPAQQQRQQQQEGEQLPGVDPADQILSPAVVRCPAGCTELYCSARCQQSHHAAHHQLLCTGPLHDQPHPRLSYNEKKARKVQRRAQVRAGIKKSATAPLLAFHRHAMRHHQFFLMAAQIVARLTLMERRGVDIAADLQALRNYAQKEWVDTIDLDEGYDDEEAQKQNVEESETVHEEHNINAAKEQAETAEEDDDGYSPDDEGGQHDHEEGQYSVAMQQQQQ